MSSYDSEKHLAKIHLVELHYRKIAIELEMIQVVQDARERSLLTWAEVSECVRLSKQGAQRYYTRRFSSDFQGRSTAE